MGKKKNRNKNRIVIVLCVILGILLVLCVGLVLTDDKENKEQSDDVYQEEIAFYEIDTEYCKLYYPERWKNQVEVKYVDENAYKVEFYGLVEGKDASHLFDVCFNSDDGELLGYLEIEDEIVNISIDVMAIEFDDTWTQEEIDQIYAMQEEMNFVIDTLNKNENYVEP